MDEKYNQFIKSMGDAGWDISITLEKGEVDACICHKSWVTDDIYQSRALPTFRGENLEDVLDKIIQYFYR